MKKGVRGSVVTWFSHYNLKTFHTSIFHNVQLSVVVHIAMLSLCGLRCLALELTRIRCPFLHRRSDATHRHECIVTMTFQQS